jgi:FkbM family methyltransferase
MFGYLRRKINLFTLNAAAAYRKRKLAKTIDHTKVAHLEETVSCKKAWYGSSYGGFYINPDLLSSKSVVYSFGIGKDMSFDLACIRKHQCQVFGFDPTPKSIQWIKAQKIHGNFHFQEFGISVGKSGKATFYIPENPHGTSGSLFKSDELNIVKPIEVTMKSFEDIAAELGHSHLDVLKMDIEGSEYEVLENVLKSRVTIDQILVEFHDRQFDQQVYRSRSIVNKLRESGYEIFAHSDTYEEISFIKTTLINN